MAVRKSIKTPTTPPTLEQRRNAALATSDAAVSVFYQAAYDLETAAAELDEVEAQAAAEAARLNELSSRAFAEAQQQRAQADAIRTLLGGAQN